MACGFSAGKSECKERKDVTMNIRTNSRSGAARVFSWVLTFALVFSLVAVPAASADDGTYSAEVVLSMEGADISGKLTLDTNQLLLGALAAMTSEGQTMMEAAAYLGAQALVVDSALVGGTYGLDLTALAQNLPSSIFAPGSGSAYALDEESFQQIMNLLEGKMPAAATAPTMDTTAVEEAAAVLAEAYSEIPAQVMGLLTIESSSASVVIDSKPIQVQQIRCSADANSAVNITKLLLQPAIDDPQVQNALAVMIDFFAASSQQDLGATGEELVQAIVQELPSELDTARQELIDAGFSVSSVVCVTPDTQMPVKLALEMTAEGSTLVVNILLNDTLDFFRFELVEDMVVANALEFRITETPEDALELRLSVQEGGNEIAAMSFNLNLAGKAFLLSATADGETHSLSGFYSISENQFSITVDRMDGAEFGGTVTLNLRSDDSITLPSFTEVSTMTEEEFTALVQTVSTVAESLSEMFG